MEKFPGGFSTRKKFFIILIITAISFFYFAQPLSARADETKTFVGTIKSFAYGFGFRSGPPLWPLGMIEVVADNGQKNNFLFVGSGRPRAAIFYDIDGKNLGMVTEGLSRTEAAKKVGIGKKVEVTYTTPQETARFIHRNLAISVRYVPTDYVSSTTAAGQSGATGQYSVTENAAGEQIFVGKIASSSPTFRIPPMRKIVLVADNGEKLTVFVSRDIAIRDMHAAPTRIGKRAEVKFSLGATGENEAISFRYLD